MSFKAHPRLMTGAGILIALGGTLLALNVEPALALLWAFDAAALFFLVSTAVMFTRETPDTMRKRAKDEDVGRWGILWTSVLLSAVVLIALGVELRGDKQQSVLSIAVAASSIMLSWLYMNTMFALHYAHGFYGNYGEAHKGLDFPGDEEPDYWDFAYFALVLGMTFQVSDVQITSRHLRRMALVHSVIAFVVNVFIIAMSVNIVAGQA
jgi:uncharacterized membrane protein